MSAKTIQFSLALPSAVLGYDDLPKRWVLSEPWLLCAIKNSRVNLRTISLDDSFTDVEQKKIKDHLSTLESMQWELGIPLDDVVSEVEIRDFHV